MPAAGDFVNEGSGAFVVRLRSLFVSLVAVAFAAAGDRAGVAGFAAADAAPTPLLADTGFVGVVAAAAAFAGVDAAVAFAGVVAALDGVVGLCAAVAGLDGDAAAAVVVVVVVVVVAGADAGAAAVVFAGLAGDDDLAVDVVVVGDTVRFLLAVDCLGGGILPSEHTHAQIGGAEKSEIASTIGQERERESKRKRRREL